MDPSLSQLETSLIDTHKTSTPQVSNSKSQRKKVLINEPLDDKSSAKLQKSINPDPEIKFLGRRFHFFNMKKLGDITTHLKVDKRKTDKREEKKNKYLKSYIKYLIQMSEAKFMNYAEDEKSHNEIGTELVTSGAVTVLCDVIIDIFKLGYRRENGKVIKNNFIALKSSLSALVNFTSCYQQYSDAICKHADFLERTTAYLRRMKRKEELLQEEVVTLMSVLVIIHNVVMCDKNIPKVRTMDYIDVLTPYLDSPIRGLRLVAIAVMADIVTEEESKVFLQKEENSLNFLVMALQSATESETGTHPDLNWPIFTIAQVVRKIARYEKIKKVLMSNGLLPVLVVIAGSRDMDERREAIVTLRSLSFDRDIQTRMVADISLGVIDILQANIDSVDPEIEQACKGALLLMKEKLLQSEMYKNTVPKPDEKESTHSLNSICHVVISYELSNQKMAKKIREFLKLKEYNVSMENGEKHTELSVKVLDEADIVIVCCSNNYKENENCRTVLEYTFQKGKRIIPLKLETAYRASIWLDKISGDRKQIEFDAKGKFDCGSRTLLKEIEKAFANLKQRQIEEQLAISRKLSIQTNVLDQPRRGSSTPLETEQALNPAEVLSSLTRNSTTMDKDELFSTLNSLSVTQTVLDTDIKEWTKGQVCTWLDKHQLDRTKFEKLRGPEIAYLKILLERSLDNYNNVLREQLDITDLSTMASFTCALSDTSINQK